MSSTKSKLTVFFEEPFWVGIYERSGDGKYEVCKITFGSEPKDYEVYDFLLENWNKLYFNQTVEGSDTDQKRINPKRMQREIKRQLQDTGVSTKAQQALKLGQEQGKLERKTKTRQQRDEEKQFQFELGQEKRKAKHRGH